MNEMVIDRDQVTDAAASLLYAAMLLRDMAGAMPVTLQAGMPPDISGRMFHTRYQDSFDRLPSDVRHDARQIVEADELFQAARAVHIAGSGGTNNG